MKPLVDVIDDDITMRETLPTLIKSIQLSSVVFESAEEFLAEFKPGRTGCIVADIRMPGRSGIDLFRELKEQDDVTPIIVYSAYTDVRMAVEAMKLGIFDVIEKTEPAGVLLSAIQRAVAHSLDQKRRTAKKDAVVSRYNLLSTREKDVLKLVIEGKLSKVIASELGISINTVEIHRRNIMKKTGAHSVAVLVRSLIASGIIAP